MNSASKVIQVLPITSSIEIHKIEGSTFVNYFDGQELNEIIFEEQQYIFQNVEMETTESGTYEFASTSNMVILHRSQIVYPSGEKELDNTIFIAQFPNDTTLIHTKRIEFNKRTQKQDTILLEPFPMYLK